MAKFIYRMQSILNIKHKLETQARMEYAEARAFLTEEEEKLALIRKRKADYEESSKTLLTEILNVQMIKENKYAILRMEEQEKLQIQCVVEAEKELEKARIKLTEIMQERKIYEKLREKAFEEFKVELNAQEGKEVDELTSYVYGQKKKNNKKT